MHQGVTNRLFLYMPFGFFLFKFECGSQHQHIHFFLTHNKWCYLHLKVLARTAKHHTHWTPIIICLNLRLKWTILCSIRQGKYSRAGAIPGSLIKYIIFIYFFCRLMHISHQANCVENTKATKILLIIFIWYLLNSNSSLCWCRRRNTLTICWHFSIQSLPATA